MFVSSVKMEGRGFICLLMLSLMLICDLNAMSIHGIPSAQHLDEGRKAELVLGSLFGKMSPAKFITAMAYSNYSIKKQLSFTK